jgi:predicted DNA-binding transcriptional regulator AlpA
MRARSEILPPSLPPRGLSRAESAAYIGVSPSLFDELVKDGRMPAPKRINSRTVWDRKKLDVAFDAILDDESRAANPWDDES